MSKQELKSAKFDLNMAQHDEGWNKISRPCVELIEHMGGTILQVKEKLGGLRIYYSAPKQYYPALDLLVRGAEVEAQHTCERCGKHDYKDVKLHHRSSGWLKTLCPPCAKELDYAVTDGPNDDRD